MTKTIGLKRVKLNFYRIRISRGEIHLPTMNSLIDNQKNAQVPKWEDAEIIANTCYHVELKSTPQGNSQKSHKSAI